MAEDKEGERLRSANDNGVETGRDDVETRRRNDALVLTIVRLARSRASDAGDDQRDGVEFLAAGRAHEHGGVLTVVVGIHLLDERRAAFRTDKLLSGVTSPLAPPFYRVERLAAGRYFLLKQVVVGKQGAPAGRA